MFSTIVGIALSGYIRFSNAVWEVPVRPAVAGLRKLAPLFNSEIQEFMKDTAWSMSSGVELAELFADDVKHFIIRDGITAGCTEAMKMMVLRGLAAGNKRSAEKNEIDSFSYSKAEKAIAEFENSHN